MAEDALALYELDGVAVGLASLDALVKRAPVRVHEANLIEPGRFLLLFGGGVAEVEESARAVEERAGEAVLDRILLPMAHPAISPALRADPARPGELDTLGIVEGRSVACTLHACDRALKEADVGLLGLRVAVGLGGRAYFLVHGRQHDVEAALEIGGRVLDERQARHRIERVARPHEEMVGWLLRPAPFSPPPRTPSPLAPPSGAGGR